MVWPVLPEIDDRLTIEPPPDCFIASTACFVPRNTPREFTAISRSHASVSSMSATALPLMPALLTRISSLPCFCTVAATTAFQSSSFVTSRRMNSAVPLARVISAATWRPSSSSMSATTTFAPSLAKRRAVAAPMPEAAPVTIATFPSRRMLDPPGITVAPTLPRAAWLGYRRRTLHHGRERIGVLTYGPSRHDVRHLPGSLPSRGREPDAGDEPRRRTAGVAGLAWLRRGLDRRAPFGRLGTDCAA